MRSPELLPVLICALVCGACGTLPEPRDAAALGISAADHALDFVAAHTPADDAAALARIARVRVALEVAAKFVDGKAPAPEGVAALAEALRVADVAVRELDADGVKVPREVKAALAAARSLISE